MNGKGNVKKDKATEIIAAINDYENKVISSFLDRIKEKFLKLEKMKDELAARKEVLQRIAEEKILNEIKSSQKEEMQDSTAEEPVAPKTEIKAEREETDTHIANEEAVQIDEKAAVIDENSKIIPFIKDEGAASAVRKVEPIRTVKPVAEKKDDSSFTETSTTASHKKKGASEKIKGSKLDKRNLNKKAKIKKGYEQDSSSVVYDESGEIRKIRTRKSNADKKKSFKPAPMVIEKAVINTENITIKLLSEKIGKTAVEIIKKLLDLGIFKTINDTIDFDTAELIAAEFGITLEKQIEQTSEEKLLQSLKMKPTTIKPIW